MSGSGEHSAKGPWRLGLIVFICCAALLAAGYFALLAAFPPARLATMLGDQVKRATGRDFQVKGALSIRLFPTLAVLAHDVVLSNADWGSRPAMLTVRRTAFAIALRPLLDGEIRILSVDVEGADMLLESDGKGRGNWAFGKAGASAGESATAGPAIDLDQLSVANSQVTYRDAAKGSTFALAVEQFDLRKQGDQARLALALGFDKQRWQIDGLIGRPLGLLDDKADWPFDLILTTEGAKLSAKGMLGTGARAGSVRADVSATISKADLLKTWGVGEALLPVPLDIQTTLVRSADAIQADPLRVAHAGEVLTGRIGIAGSGEKMHVTGQIASPSFDLAKWLPGKSAPAASGKKPAQLFGDTPLPFAALPSIPMQLDIRVERLILPDTPPLFAVAGHVRSAAGRFAIDPLSLSVEGGQVTGRVEVIHSPGMAPRTALLLDARGLSVEALAGHGRDIHGGRADLKADLTLTGDTPRQLAASANGELLLSVRRVTLAGKAATLERNPLESVLRALLPGQQAEQGLAIDCGVARLPLRRGVAAIDRSIAVETDQMAVSASGEVNLARQTLALAFRPKVKKGLGLSQSSLVQLVMLKGPLQAPEIAIDPKGTMQEAASIGVAVATGGLSLLAGRMLDEREGTDACRIAAGGSSSSAAARRGGRAR